VYALDPVDGAERWTAEGYGAFSTAPVLVGRSLYVGNSDGALYRVDLDDGGVAWKVELGAPVTGEPAIVGGLCVVGLANGRLVALGGG
jgi:outer membrane protein assembly factor BamB